MTLSKLTLRGVLPLLGAWLGCNAIVGLEPGHLNETGSASAGTTDTSTSSSGGGGAGGGLPGCTSEVQCPVSPSECAPASCVNSACGFVNEEPGTLCGPGKAKVCDGAGDCVECLGSGGCSGGETCELGSCVAAKCSNMMLDPDETGTDCGGPCAPCADGEGCNSAMDCQSGVCQGAGGAGGGGSGTCEVCGTDADCIDITDTYCELGDCTPKKGQGVPCNQPGQCLSGSCPVGDNVCCAEPCNLMCKSCNGMETSSPTGECGFILQNTDPDDECMTTLVCNGNGACF